jgi:Ca-activated chloride channel homolog
MRWNKKIVIFVVSVFFIGVALIGFQTSNAQQSVPPSPTATPTPTVSPTPETIIEDDEVLQVETEVVNVLFTATDNNRRFLTDLKQTDIKIFEDGKPQEVFAFYRQVDLPLSLAILIDVSASQERTLPEEKNAAKAFIEDVIRPEKDEVAIVSFTGETTLEQGLTNNVPRLRRSIDRVEFVPPSGYLGGGVVVGGRTGTPPVSGRNQSLQGSTAIWDAIWVTADEVLGKSPDRTRRAIILVTDGINTSGRKKLDDAVQAAIKAEAVIYCVGIGDNFYGGVDEGVLRKISERTGGHAYFPREESDLRRAFAQIQVEMRSQFLVAYSPTNDQKDGTYRKIEIQVANPDLAKQKVKLTHRQGYFAKTAKKAEVKQK